MFVHIPAEGAHVVRYGDRDVTTAGCIGWMRYDEPPQFQQRAGTWARRLALAVRHGDAAEGDDVRYGVLRMAADLGVVDPEYVSVFAECLRADGDGDWARFADRLESFVRGMSE